MVDDTFGNLEDAFVELYEQCGDGSWSIEVRFNEEHISPVLRASIGCFECLHTKPIDQIKEQEAIFEREGLETTREAVLKPTRDQSETIYYDDHARLTAEGDVLTPEHAADITRTLLSNVYESHEANLQIYKVHEGDGDKDNSVVDVLPSQVLRRSYALISIVTVALWLPLLAFLADGFGTISTSPLELLNTAFSIAGYAGFVIAFAVGVGTGTYEIYRNVPEVAANQMESTPFSEAVDSTISHLVVGVVVGVIGGLTFVVQNYYSESVVFVWADILAGLLAILGFVGIIAVLWLWQKSPRSEVVTGFVLFTPPVGIWTFAVISAGSVSGTWTFFILGSMFAISAIMGLVSPTTITDTNLQAFLDRCEEARSKYTAAKHRRKSLEEAAPPDIPVDVDIETCNPDVADGPDTAIERLNCVHSDLTRIGETIEQYSVIMEEYETLQEYKNEVKRRATPFDAIDVDVSIRSYQPMDDEADDYLAYLESLRTDLSNLEELTNAWERAEEEYVTLQGLQKRLDQRAEPFGAVDVGVEIMPISIAAAECEIADYQSHRLC